MKRFSLRVDHRHPPQRPSLSRFTTLPAAASFYRTSATENYLYLGEAALTDRQLVAEIEAQSVTTFVLGGVQ